MAYRKKLRGPLESYEDPILLNELKRKMQERVAKARDEGLDVTHEYMSPSAYNRMYGIPRSQRRNAHKTSPGEWHAATDFKAVPGQPGIYDIRRQKINVPLTPSLANAWVLGEEYAHAKEAQKLGGKHENTIKESMEALPTFQEEMRAKGAADEFIGGYHTPDSRSWADWTRDGYRSALVPWLDKGSAIEKQSAYQGLKDEREYQGKNPNPYMDGNGGK